MVGLFVNPATFVVARAQGVKISASQPPLVAVFHDLKPGTYAISASHDETGSAVITYDLPPGSARRSTCAPASPKRRRSTPRLWPMALWRRPACPMRCRWGCAEFQERVTFCNCDRVSRT